MQGREFTLSAESVLALPVDELALEVLRDLTANHEWNTGNWLRLAERGYQDEESQVEVLLALQEAWGWLYQKGLVVPSWRQTFGAMVVTRYGQRVAQEGLAPVRASERLDVDLHPLIGSEARPQFLMEKYELAAFASLRQVEVRMRDLAGAPQNLVGVPLARMAWGPSGPAPLADLSLEGGERQAAADLFAGAMGVFKNPTSHRIVEFSDPTRAAEVVLLADLLMRMLDDAELRLSGRTP